jgi:SNF2 family DNA or RNA helicase
VEELYSLIKFLQIRPLNDWPTFNEQINKPVKGGRSVRAMKRLQVVLKAIMLRRRKDHILNGKPILNLPARSVEIVYCEFSATEREFYNAIQAKVSDSLDKIMGQEKRSYTSILLLLLRLRQGKRASGSLFSVGRLMLDQKRATTRC